MHDDIPSCHGYKKSRASDVLVIIASLLLETTMFHRVSSNLIQSIFCMLIFDDHFAMKNAINATYYDSPASVAH